MGHRREFEAEVYGDEARPVFGEGRRAVLTVESDGHLFASLLHLTWQDEAGAHAVVFALSDVSEQQVGRLLAGER